jgi:hypothetical protein
MSWKSLVGVGLLCMIASPALATATLEAVKGGTEASGFLNVAGNWVWRINITPTGGSAVAAEIGFRETTFSELLGATANATNFDKNNTGTKIFSWQPDPPVFSEGIVTNLPTDEVFTALGSSEIISMAVSTHYIDIEVQGPSVLNNRLSTTLEWLGAFDGSGLPGGTNGVIAETVDGNPIRSIVAGSATFTAKWGDANLDGSVGFSDFNAWLTSTGTRWQDGDFNDDGSVGFADLKYWLSSPGGAGGISIVPEPASLDLLTLSPFLCGVFWSQRTRSQRR